VPIAFTLPYSSATIDPKTTYTIVAAIQDGDRTWTTAGGTPVVTKGAPTSGLDLVLIYRADLAKGNVTGSISGVDIELSANAFSATVLLDLTNETAVGLDVNLAPGAVPIPFTVTFDPATINQQGSYVVTAGIIDGSSKWGNDTGVPVITNGNPITNITVPVAALGTTTPPADSGLGALGTIIGIIGIAALIAAAVVFIRSRRPMTPAPVGPDDGADSPPEAGPDDDAGPPPDVGPDADTGPDSPAGPDAGAPSDATAEPDAVAAPEAANAPPPPTERDQGAGPDPSER
jgi:uncharacterized lipoprotein YbaY